MNQLTPIPAPGGRDLPDPVEQASIESFPASDPPPWWKGTPSPRTCLATQPVVIEFRGANCTWCLNTLLGHLRGCNSVVSATLHAGTGCIEVRADAADLDDLLAALEVDLRGWNQADNGERVMVQLAVHESQQCPFSPQLKRPPIQ